MQALVRWQMEQHFVAERIFFAIVMAVAGILLFADLDDQYLWQDEAETAVLSRRLLSCGLPLANDGRNLVQQADAPFVEYTADYIWIYHSWLQYGLTALFFALLGPTTTAARLPFVTTGLLTIVLFYRLSTCWLENARIPRLAMLLLVFCIPFILHMRQCRYYALAALFTLTTLDAYLLLPSGKAYAMPYFVLSAMLLYHSHYGAFFPTMGALTLGTLFSSAHCRERRLFVPALVLVILGVLPWAIFMRVWARGAPFTFDRFTAHLTQYFVYVTGWLFPLLLLLLLAGWYARSRTAEGPLDAREAPLLALFSLVIVANIILLAAFAVYDWVYFRYIVHLVPLLRLPLAITVDKIYGWVRPLGIVVLVMLTTTNVLHLVPYGLPSFSELPLRNVFPTSVAWWNAEEVWHKTGQFRSELWMYALELIHPYEGPIEGLVAYLQTHAKPGDTVLVNNEDLPLMFYTDLKIIGGLSAHDVTGIVEPDWVIDRQYGHYRDTLAKIIAAGHYERIELPYPDIHWENRPQPGSHHYLTARGIANVTLYRRIE